MKIPELNKSKLKLNRRYSPKAVALAVVLAITGVVTLALSNASPLQTNPTDTSNEETATIIVRYKKSADTANLDSEITKVSNGHQTRHLKHLGMKIVKVPKNKRDQAIKELAADPTVETAEADVKVHLAATPNDPSYSEQWAWPKIQMPAVWDKTTGSANTVIATIDTGANIGHVDLLNRFVAGYNVLTSTTDVTDNYGHGTIVAGIIGATANNSIGIAGGCWGCKILPIKVMDGEDGNMSDVLNGIEYALTTSAKVINLSLVSSTPVQALQDAINQATAKGMVVAAAAGNESSNVLQYPAAFDNVISVGGSETDDSLVFDSSYGPWVDIAAPGNTILSTYIPNNMMATSRGTSFASPEVAALVGLMKDKYPNASVTDIANAITTTGDTCCASKIPNGRLNAAKAFAKLETSQTGIAKMTVAITAPAAGATVSGAVNITATVSADQPVSKVVLTIDGGSAVTDTTVPYSFSWDSTKSTNGGHVLTVTATDATGATATASRNVTVTGGLTPTPTPTGKPGDVNGDGSVNLVDLSMMLSNWNKTTATGDLNGNGKVDLFDLSILLSNWNK